MIRPFMFALVGVVCLGCGPGTRAGGGSVRIGMGELVQVYRSNPDSERYLGRVIQVYLGPHSYRPGPNRIEAFLALPGTPGAIYFECPSPPADSETPLVVTGTCRGLVRDGVRRGAGIDWYVRVEGCSFTTLAPN